MSETLRVSAYALSAGVPAGTAGGAAGSAGVAAAVFLSCGVSWAACCSWVAPSVSSLYPLSKGTFVGSIGSWLAYAFGR